jgi:hypothetical protein
MQHDFVILWLDSNLQLEHVDEAMFQPERKTSFLKKQFLLI